MNDICIDCWNWVFGTRCNERDFLLSDKPEICDGCNKPKLVILRKRRLVKRKNPKDDNTLFRKYKPTTFERYENITQEEEKKIQDAIKNVLTKKHIESIESNDKKEKTQKNRRLLEVKEEKTDDYQIDIGN